MRVDARGMMPPGQRVRVGLMFQCEQAVSQSELSAGRSIQEGRFVAIGFMSFDHRAYGGELPRRLGIRVGGRRVLYDVGLRAGS